MKAKFVAATGCNVLYGNISISFRYLKNSSPRLQRGYFIFTKENIINKNESRSV